MSNTQPTTDTDRTAALAAGLRDLTAVATGYPDLARALRYAFDRVHVYIGGGDPRAQLVAFARAGLAAGATVTEHDDSKYAGVDVAFGPIGLHVYAPMEKVHGATCRTVEQVDGVCRITEYTPRSILAEIATDDDSPSEMGAVA